MIHREWVLIHREWLADRASEQSRSPGYSFGRFRMVRVPNGAPSTASTQASKTSCQAGEESGQAASLPTDGRPGSAEPVVGQCVVSDNTASWRAGPGRRGGVILR